MDGRVGGAEKRTGRREGQRNSGEGSKEHISIYIMLCVFCFFSMPNSSEARNYVSKASILPGGARISRGPVGALKF